jgi:protein-L-isoaspartate(D-aspartate) O-methyltransferase
MAKEPDFVRERTRLVEELTRSGYIRDPRVRDAFRTVAREAFVGLDDRRHAYVDSPLSIPHGQTISAPSMIAIMLEEARLRPGERVLEIGTGSGYHAALLASLAGPANVVTVERISDLAAWGRSNLVRAGFEAVEVVVGDGSLGYPLRAPYDLVIATAGAPRIAEPWAEQLSPHGRIVAPVGDSPREQVLAIANLGPDGTLRVRYGTPCAFVPLVGERAWHDD